MEIPDELAMEGMISFEEIPALDIVTKKRKLEPHAGTAKVSKKKSKLKETENSSVKKKPKEREAVLKASAWDSYSLDATVKKGLLEQGFLKPTNIQRNVLDSLKEYPQKDVAASAQTGSGKTLAFGLPILQRVFENPDSLVALVLVPTRELGVQVTQHLKTTSVYSRCRVVPIIGGMSEQKQERQLKSQPNIIVATPGRLWELVGDGSSQLKSDLMSIQFLVLDEADRLVEKNHFTELKNILDVLQSVKKQTFLFSATLDFTEISIPHKGKSKQVTLSSLVSSDAIKIETDSVLASKLLDSKILCIKEEKDIFLYYFLLKYKKRTLVFVNSIDSIRRLVPLLTLLNIKSIGLHSQMQQRQRLSNLDKFKAWSEGVLVCSDVAARGLDIPAVDHVVHYHLPKSPMTYIHRSGRTARAANEGLSLALVSEQEQNIYKKICHSTGKNSIEDMPYDIHDISKLKPRVSFALEIDKIEHRLNKQKHDDLWWKKNAKIVEIDSEEEIDESSKVNEEKIRSILKQKKSQLKKLISTPIVSKRAKPRYPTASVIQDMPQRIVANSGEIFVADKVQSAIQQLKEKMARKNKN